MRHLPVLGPPHRRLVAEFDHGLLKDDTRYPYVVQCEQFKLTRILVDRMRDLPQCDIRFSHRVSAVKPADSSVTVTVETPSGPETFTGPYLIGCDGGQSQVRRDLGIEYKGFTWPERFLVLTTPFDFERERGFVYRNYIADPDEWCNCFKVAAEGPPGLWRCVFPADPDAPVEEVMAMDAAQARMQKFFPIGGDYDIVHRNIYTVHQRVAASFRQGRVLLAGDASHVNNSIGGMGLNGGIQDAMNLCEKLARVIKGEARDTELDLYDLQRRAFATDFVQQQSIENKKRLEARDPAQRKTNLDELRAMAADKARARQFMLKSSMITDMRRVAEMKFP